MHIALATVAKQGLLALLLTHQIPALICHACLLCCDTHKCVAARFWQTGFTCLIFSSP